MSNVIEETLKALTEFESQLNSARTDASEARRQMVKNAAEWAESAKAKAIASARRIASETASKAREEAEREAESIRKKEQATLKVFEGSMSRRKSEAAELVADRLLGESG
jgi:vacuolar-type H+-ATPase subunit H